MAQRFFFLSRAGTDMLRAILAGVLLLTTGIISAVPTDGASAQGLARNETGGMLVGDGRVALEPITTLDDYPGAKIGSLPYQDLDVDISGAKQLDPSDPAPILMGDCNSGPGEYSVWYNYNPGEQNAYISVDTIGSDYDTLIAVWTGGPGSFNLVACNDDISTFEIQSELKLFAQASTTYYFEVIKYAEPASGLDSGLEADATGNTLDFHVTKINYQLDPPSLNFGNQLIRNMTVVKTVTYTNLNGSPVQIGTLSVSDSYAKKQTMFLKNNTCDNVLLNDGESCTFGVAFRPWVAGLVTGNVMIPSNAPDQPHYLFIKGRGILGTVLGKNLSFELDKDGNRIPDFWSGKNLTRNLDVRTSKFKYQGTFSMRLVGQNPRKFKTLTQVIYKKGVRGDDFYMQAWSKAYKAPTMGARIIVYWYNGTKLVGKQSMAWGKGSYSFQTRWKAFTAPAPYTRIVMQISYAQASGSVWTDKVILRWAPSPK